jgi:hypothetical protein
MGVREMATAVTSGVWPSMTASPPGRGGLGTSNVRWGVPAGGGQSGYRFAGSSVEVLLDGTEFVLGTFTHDNFPVYGFQPNQFDVDLRVHVAFDGGVLEREFSFSFHHNETPNVGAHPEDLVDLPTLQSPETVEIDGEEYAVVIAGFKQGGQLVTRFVSQEDGSNSADIVARLQLIARPIQTYIFHTHNPDGSVFGSGCFQYKGETPAVDIAHVIGGLGHGPKLMGFWYSDPLLATLGLPELMGMNFKRGVEDGERSRFIINAFTLPGQDTGIAAGVATLKTPGPVSTHRVDDEEHGGEGRTLHFPELCIPGIASEAAEPEVPLVDLVVVMDSSASMKPDATSLSDAVSAAIKAAETGCPSDLRVSYLGIEGKFADSLFRTTIREHLTKLRIAESAMRGRKRGTVAAGGAQEDVARAIEDVVSHNDWRPGTKKAVFVLGDEAMEGGDTFEQADVDAANMAIAVANAADARVHTYLAKGDPKLQAANMAEFARVAAETGGQAYTYEDTLDGGFQAMLEDVICASKQPEQPVEDCGCCKECMEKRTAATAP